MWGYTDYCVCGVPGGQLFQQHQAEWQRGDRIPSEITEPCHAQVSNTHKTHTHRMLRVRLVSPSCLMCENLSVWQFAVGQVSFPVFRCLPECVMFSKNYLSSSHTFCCCPPSFFSLWFVPFLTSIIRFLLFRFLTDLPSPFFCCCQLFFFSLLSIITWLYPAHVLKRPQLQTNCSRKRFLCDVHPAPCFAERFHIISHRVPL